VAYHRGSATLGAWHPETVRRISRNQVLLVARHYPDKLVAGWMWRLMVAQGLWGLLALRHGAGWAWLRGKMQGILQYSTARANSQSYEVGVLERLLTTNDELIRKTPEPDRYWRMYFLLTGSGSK
jgi:hypothetical protein